MIVDVYLNFYYTSWHYETIRNFQHVVFAKMKVMFFPPDTEEHAKWSSAALPCLRYLSIDHVYVTEIINRLYQ